VDFLALVAELCATAIRNRSCANLHAEIDDVLELPYIFVKGLWISCPSSDESLGVGSLNSCEELANVFV
jgi:hypothetical protein